MATKTFSGRVDENKLQYADLICNQELGISFGQYCSGVLTDFIYETGTLPNTRVETAPNEAITKMQRLISQCALQKKTGFGTIVADMDDEGLSDLASTRYE